MSNINVWDKVDLSIDQVSQLTGVKKTTLRYWEKEFSDYLKPDRTETQRRRYSLGEVEKVAVLKQLIEEEKYKSAGVRIKLGLNSPAAVSAPATTPNAATASAVETPPAATAPPSSGAPPPLGSSFGGLSGLDSTMLASLRPPGTK